MKLLCFVFAVCTSLPLLDAGDTKTGFRDLLKNGLEDWQGGSAKAPPKGWTIEDNALTLGKGGGYIWTKDRFGDFILDLEVLTTGNSGVFIRTDKLSDPVQTGIEVQVDTPSAKPGKHSFGAFYDL